MSYCTNINCLSPQNPDTANFCMACGQKFLLKERYRPVKLIGHGGFGRTFLAIDEYLPSQSKCVIKQLYFAQSQANHFKQKAWELFRQEAIRLDDLGQHQQIPQLLAYFEQDEQLYLVQEWVAGNSLMQEIEQQGVFGESQIRQLLQKLLPVLQFIHSQNIIHRDIKPANIMRGCIAKDTNAKTSNSNLFLIDFGIAKHLHNTTLQQTGTKIGTPEYMAPEQLRGKVLPASDIYSLGVTCIYLLTGISPFDLFDVSEDRWVWRDYLLPQNKVSTRLGKILDKMLQNSLPNRYQKANDVLQALSRQAISSISHTQSFDLTATETEEIKIEIDYTQLQNLLKKGKWQEADKETWKIMCVSLSKPIGTYLFKSDIEKLSDDDLQKIDQLWMRYSKGHFGFSVQKEIYDSVDADYVQFCNMVGWATYNSYSSANSDYYYSLKAPIGHLPTRTWMGGSQWWRHADTFAAKLDRILWGVASSD
ncbi:serine/threonine protein kinase [Rivularia sp. PCC 7116]|uniref:serine/threonine-protein kinase n=1 Tax=Rivularia sp. PCC 7116 TaxID=373994 RepID=UPI00029F2A0C|nr:serine/threonine-protein kinase [Rivularia sp. PCC 7116]AFY55262.1 serine/threonine protein kinase [Rivularia sp. PCC 7116]